MRILCINYQSTQGSHMHFHYFKKMGVHVHILCILVINEQDTHSGFLKKFCNIFFLKAN